MASEPNSPRTPHAPETHQMLPMSPTQATPFLPENNGALAGAASPPARTPSFVSSPLNPQGPPGGSSFRPGSRPASRGSSMNLGASRFPSDDSPMPAGPYPFSRESQALSMAGARGSMVLYRLADEPDRTSILSPPRALGSGNRESVASFMSTESPGDSKYPSGLPSRGGLVPYAYDPALDELEPPDEEDFLHDPTYKQGGYHGPNKFRPRNTFPWRGVFNIGVLIILVCALLALFISYPVITFFRDRNVFNSIDSNIRVNSTGQVADLPNTPTLVDVETPQSALTRTGFDGESYTLVFSDEFNSDGRTFYPGDDPYWEAVDLWYGNTADLEWYDPSQVMTKGGNLVITMDSTSTTLSGQSQGSTAPFTVDENHNQTYRSGMLQSWNKFCFTRGYIEVAIVLPGPNANTQGYWPGAWTMGNLARPGYTATTDGTWPYTYSSCDVGTYPNQTNPDGLGPAAALHTDAGSKKYDFKLSYLSGQKLSACSCPGSDHPGPDVTVGRGAPEIDILEAEKDKANVAGQVVSQSAQFAPFTADYLYNNDSSSWTVFDSTVTRPNSYKGSAVQQAVSGLTSVPGDGFQGSGKTMVTYGFEYWSDPKDPSGGFITWQVDGKQSIRMAASAVSGDPNGSGVGQRLIPVEPMSIILNLGISNNWQQINLDSMVFPAEMLVDYVRVYQRDGETNLGCDPPDYPTMDYINNHFTVFDNPNITTWQWDKPKNSLFDGGC